MMQKSLGIVAVFAGLVLGVWWFGFHGLPPSVILHAPPPEEIDLPGLDERTSVDVRDQPVEVVLQALIEPLGVPLEIDPDARLTTQDLITCRLSDVRRRTLLQLIVRQVRSDLRVLFHRGRIVVVPQANLARGDFRITRLYRFDRPGGLRVWEQCVSQLVNRPQRHSFPGAELIAATTDQHRVLERIREILAEPPSRDLPDVIWLDGDEPADQQLAERMDQIVAWEFRDEPLDAALERLGREHGLQFWLDRIEMKRHRINPQQQIRRSVPRTPLRAALRGVLIERGLVWESRDGVIAVLPQNISWESQKGAYLFRSDFHDGEYQFGKELPRRRKVGVNKKLAAIDAQAEHGQLMTPRRRQIEEQLTAPIALQFEDASIQDVIAELQRRTGWPFFLGWFPDHDRITYVCENLPLEIACREIRPQLRLAANEDVVTWSFGSDEETRYFPPAAVPSETDDWARILVGCGGGNFHEIVNQRHEVQCSRCGQRQFAATLAAVERRRASPGSIEPIAITDPYASYDRPVRERFHNALERFPKETPTADFQDWFTANVEPLVDIYVDLSPLIARAAKQPADTQRDWLIAAVKNRSEVVDGRVVIEGHGDRLAYLYPAHDLTPVNRDTNLADYLRAVAEVVGVGDVQWIDDCLLAAGTEESHRVIAAILDDYRRKPNAPRGGLTLHRGTNCDGDPFEVCRFDVRELVASAESAAIDRSFLVPNAAVYEHAEGSHYFRLQNFPRWYSAPDANGEFRVSPAELVIRSLSAVRLAKHVDVDPWRKQHVIVIGSPDEQTQVRTFLDTLREFFAARSPEPFAAKFVGRQNGEVRWLDLRPLLRQREDLSETVVELWLRSALRPGWAEHWRDGTESSGRWSDESSGVWPLVIGVPGAVVVHGPIATLEEAEQLLRTLDTNRLPRFSELRPGVRQQAAADTLARVLRHPRSTAEWKLAVSQAMWVRESHLELTSVLTEQFVAEHADRPNPVRAALVRQALVAQAVRQTDCLAHLRQRLNDPRRRHERLAGLRAAIALLPFQTEAVEELLGVSLPRNDWSLLSLPALRFSLNTAISQNAPSAAAAKELLEALETYQEGGNDEP